MRSVIRKYFYTAMLVAGLVGSAGGVAYAINPSGQERLKHCADRWQAMKQTGDLQGLAYQAWMSQCLQAGGPAPRASKTVTSGAPAGTIPPGATARCRDGTFTTTRERAGACARHGGVERWL